MKDNLWKLVTVMVVLTMLVAGLMLLAGCGPEEEEETPAPVPAKPTATPVPADTPLPPTATPVSAVLSTDTPVPSPALSQVEGKAEGTVPPPAETKEAGGLVDDFEGGDFDDRWWSYIEEGSGSFTCTPDQPGHASAQAMRLTFEIGADGYANCGTDVDPGQWRDAGGLSFFWQADQPGLTVVMVLEMEDPTQTNPEAEGLTPFQAELQTPGEEWTPVTLTWDAFAKAEWVDESGVDVLDPTRVVGLYFVVSEEQSGSVWFDDLQLMTGPEVAMPVPTVPPTDTPVPPTAPPPQAGPVIDKWALWVGGPHLRGANIWQAIVIPELDGLEFKGPGPVGPPYTQEDFDQLAAMGANYVSISGPGLFTETPPYTIDAGVQDYLDNLLAMIAEADIFATIGFRTGPGRSEFSLCCGGDPHYESYFNDSVWEDQAAQDGWVEMWRYTAERYRDNPIVAGYKLMVEPNAAGILLDIYDPEEFYAGYAGTLYDWNQLYPRIVAGIRKVDPDTPILVGGMGWSGVAWLPYLQPTNDPRTVYVVHQYAPQDLYTHQEPDGENTYPGVFDTDWDGEADQFDRAWLDGLLSVVDEFAATHGVPVAVDEYGVQRWVPSGAAFMDDQMDLFEQRGMNYALWEWQTSWEPFAEEVHAFNFLLGPDPNNRAKVASSDLIEVITKYWSRNTTRPSNLMPAETGEATPTRAESPPTTPALPVASFLYQLQNFDLEAIGQTSYDLVVMDYSADGSDESAFSADQIAALKHSPSTRSGLRPGGEKIVLAYMSIGEAENYRFYWNPDWDADGDGQPNTGAPAWLDVENPDWENNYKVRYWDPDWQAIIYGSPHSYLDKIIAAGFDGVYLDIIDAYWYYEEQGRDSAAREMVDFVIQLADYARARQPGFFIFPQNAAELAADFPDYLAAVDGIGQEDVYYGYEEDDQPTPPDATAELEGYLDVFKNAGKLVLTVDYATTPAHVDDAYAKSRAKGYVPFVTVRGLDQLTINPGHEPH